jgi:hypothetical protein
MKARKEQCDKIWNERTGFHHRRKENLKVWWRNWTSRSKPHSFKLQRMYTWVPFINVKWPHEAAPFLKSYFSQIVTKILTIFVPRYFSIIVRRADQWTFFLWNILYTSQIYCITFSTNFNFNIISTSTFMFPKWCIKMTLVFWRSLMWIYSSFLSTF